MLKRGPYFLLLFLMFSCAEDKPTGPSRAGFRYPLQIGNEWKYDCQVTLSYKMTSGVRPDEKTQYGTHVRVVEEDVRTGSLKTFELQEQGYSSTSMWEHSSFYQNRADGLYLTAGSTETASLPKGVASQPFFGTPTVKFPAAFRQACYAHADIATSIASEFLALKYPLQAGAEWNYTEKNKPRRVNKKVIGKADVTTEAGTFKTVKIQWIVDFNGDGQFDNSVEFFDYIADEGLVKRSFLIKNLPVLDDDGGNIGSYDYLDESLLSSVTLK